MYQKQNFGEYRSDSVKECLPCLTFVVFPITCESIVVLFRILILKSIKITIFPHEIASDVWLTLLMFLLFIPTNNNRLNNANWFSTLSRWTVKCCQMTGVALLVLFLGNRYLHHWPEENEVLFVLHHSKSWTGISGLGW